MQLTNLKQITSDPWILEAIQGYKIEFWRQTTQACLPVPLHLSKKDTQLMNTKYPVLLSLLFNFPHLIRYSSLIRSTTVPGVFPTSIPALGSTAGRKAHLRGFCHAKSFRNKLQNSSWHYGETGPQKLITHSFTSGSAGMFNRTEISFLVV